MFDYYKMLEVDPKASAEVIEKAFKALSIKYHPDTNTMMSKAEAHEKWLALREAYTVLSNPAKRRAYDEQRRHTMVNIFLHEGLIGLARTYLR